MSKFPLYEVWVGVGEPTNSPGFGGRSVWTPALWGDYERIKLPLSWAKGYAERLAKKVKRPVEVRGAGKTNQHKVKETFGGMI